MHNDTQRFLMLTTLKNVILIVASTLVCSACGTPVAIVKSEQASALEHEGKHEEALSLYNEALAADPKYVIALMGRSSVYHSLGRLDEGIADLDRCVELAGSMPEPYGNRGILKLMSKNFKGAVEDFSKAIAIEPSASDYAMRAHARINLGQLAEAKADCDEAFKLEPNSPFNYRVLGIWHATKKQYKEAVRCFTKSLDLSPNDPEVLQLRAMTYTAMNLHDLAAKDRQAIKDGRGQ